MYAYVVGVGVVSRTAGVWPKLSDEFAVIVKYASGTIVPPIVFGRRAALDTAGVPEGGVAVNVAVAGPDPLVVGGTKSLAVMPPVIVPKVTGGITAKLLVP